MKRRSCRGVSLENALDNEAVEVHLRIEQRAKTVDEGHPIDPRIGIRRRAGAAQGLFHDAQENAQRQRLDRPIMFEVITQPLGNRQHPLTDWQSRKNVVGQVGRSFDHPPGVASRTDATALARAGDEKIVTALGASSAGKAMRENPAFEIPAELAFDMGWAGSTLAAIAGEFEPSGEVRLHGAIEHGTFGPATAIDGSASRSTGGRHGDTSRAIERPKLYAHTVIASMPSGCGTRALVMRKTGNPTVPSRRSSDLRHSLRAAVPRSFVPGDVLARRRQL